MGMGHAVYKTMDPRAKILKEMAAAAGQKAGPGTMVPALQRNRKGGLAGI